MRRFLFSVMVAALAVVAVPSGAGAAHSQGQGPKHDSVAGSGKIEQFGTFVHVNAQGDPDGTANGSFFVRQTFFRLPLDFSGKVTCLFVSGNKAIVAVRSRRTSPSSPEACSPIPLPGPVC
ncbi:MAG TPA: hypothetical protein VHG90_12350 [Acidimicrobiales bacterium]|nr:hypothetical protein [Acidimicrobiales bacterium]